MTNPRASRLIRQALRTPQGRAIKTENRKNQPFKAVLGDGSNSDIRASTGMVWVRRVRGTDSSANSITSAPFSVRYSGFSSYIHKAGRVVWVQPGPDGELEVARADWQDIVNSGNDPLALNFAHSSNRYLKLKNAVRAMWRPRDTTPKGTEVAFFGWLYYDNYGVLQAKGAGEAAVTYDLASLIPVTGYQRYVVMFIRTSDNTAQAFASTAQLLDDPLDLSDYAECLAQSIHNDDIPGQAFILSDAQTTIEMVDTDLGEDLRQFINQPTALGFPSTMNRNTLIREGQNVTVAGNVEVTTGNLIVEGTLVVHSHPPNITKTNIRVTENLTVDGVMEATTARVGTLAYKPADQSITAVGGITSSSSYLRIAGNGGAVNITASPQISAGTYDGQVLILEGDDDTNTVQLNDGTGVHLHSAMLIFGAHDVLTLAWDSGGSEWTELSRNAPRTDKFFPFSSPPGSTGISYAGDYYIHASSHNDFSPSTNFGTANLSYAAHVFVVLGALTVDELTITVTGTSITDEAVRTTSDTENIVMPDATAADAYYETSKKWIGQVAIVVASGTPKDCNYGFAKYWDNNNSDYRVVGLQATWRGGANDSTPNLELIHHKTTGWTYNAGSSATPPTAIAAMNTDHVTEIQVGNDVSGAWKRTNLSTDIAGSGSEGIIIQITTSSNRAFESGLFILTVKPR